MKQYLLATHYVQGQPMPSDEVIQKMFADVDAVNQEMRSVGAWVFGGGLLPPETAKVVRNTHGEATLTDGPFPEAKEQIGGFWVLKCKDIDEALDWAKKASAACLGPIEVRPFENLPD
jgi:hypothetical protein